MNLSSEEVLSLGTIEYTDHKYSSAGDLLHLKTIKLLCEQLLLLKNIMCAYRKYSVCDPQNHDPH